MKISLQVFKAEASKSGWIVGEHNHGSHFVARKGSAQVHFWPRKGRWWVKGMVGSSNDVHGLQAALQRNGHVDHASHNLHYRKRVGSAYEPVTITGPDYVDTPDDGLPPWFEEDAPNDPTTDGQRQRAHMREIAST